MISVAVDWGSTSLRAYRFDAAGECIDRVTSARGIKNVVDGDFQTAFREHVGNWMRPGQRALLSGMITSRNGWVESDYLDCPARLTDLLAAGTPHTVDGLQLSFLPGVKQMQPADVMRGEELQLLGSAAAYGDNLFLLPGTHSKWATVTDGVLHSFRTIPTGELFDLLVNQSLIGALTDSSEWNATAFLEGVDQGFSGDNVLSDLFTTRSSVLLDQRQGSAAFAWLSGLLIGREVREGQWLLQGKTLGVVLIGSDALCANYLRALQHLNIDANIAATDVTLLGFQQIIRHAHREST